MARLMRRGASLLSAMALSGGLLSACGSSNAPKRAVAPVSHFVMNAPVEVAHTSDGAVGYRSVGSGAPLVLIMGYAGTMQTWSPPFVDALARRFHVIVFDNAGVGKTSATKTTLSIDAMADQTSALMRALHLGRADVLGWSMGGMIAQALAVLHPTQVKDLVLCATYPGDGSAVTPSQADVAALTGTDVAAAAAVLFPTDQTMAAQAFSGSLNAYPAAPGSSAKIQAEQRDAVLKWFAGTDTAGTKVSTISAPTLIADGAQDALVARANDLALKGLIPHSTLRLYPDAGHAFLFQEGTVFTRLAAGFLLGVSAPAPAGTFLSAFNAANAKAKSAGTAWTRSVRSATTAKSPTAFAQANVKLVDATDEFVNSLLDLGATGERGRLVGAFVAAENNVARDVLALGAQSSSSLAAWTKVSDADNAAALAAYNALRENLGLTVVTTTTTSKSSPPSG